MAQLKTSAEKRLEYEEAFDSSKAVLFQIVSMRALQDKT